MFDEFGFIDAFGGGGADIAPIAFDPAPIADTAWTPSLDSSMLSPDMAMGGAGGFDGGLGDVVGALADAGRFDLIPPVLEAAAGPDGLSMMPESLAPVSQASMPEAAPLDAPMLMALMNPSTPEANPFIAPWNPMGDLGQTPTPPTPLIINPEQQFSAQALSGWERGIQPPPKTDLDGMFNNALVSQSEPAPPGTVPLTFDPSDYGPNGAQSFDESGFSLPPLQHNDGGPPGLSGAQSFDEGGFTHTQPDFSWVFGGQPEVPADTFGDRFGNWQQQSPASVISDHFKDVQQSGAASFDEGGFGASPFEHNDGGYMGAQSSFQQHDPRSLQSYFQRPPQEMLPGSTPEVRSFVENAYKQFPGIKLTSAARTPETNIGGAKGSQHLSGNATDWNLSALNPQQRQEFIQYARQQGAGGLGAYNAEGSKVHVDFRKGSMAAWGPNYSHTSLGQTPQWFQQIAAEHRGGQPVTAAYSPPPAKPEGVNAINAAVKEANKDFAAPKEGVGEGPQIVKGDEKPAPGYTAPKAEVKQFIHDEAVKRGIDPKIAIKVAKHEGLDQWQSTVVKDGQRENSWGPFQLFTGDGKKTGLGNEFQKKTGLDPSDPNNWKEGTTFALDHIAKNGWGKFYGAKAAGVTGKMGIGEAAAPVNPKKFVNVASVDGNVTTYSDGTKIPNGDADYPPRAQVVEANLGQRKMDDQGGGLPAIFSGLFGGGQGGGQMPAIMGGGGRNPFNDPGSLAAMELIVNSLSRAAPIHGLAAAAASDRNYQEQQLSRQATEMALVKMGFKPQEARALSYNPQAAQMLYGIQQDELARKNAATLFGGDQSAAQPAPAPAAPSPNMLSPNSIADTPAMGQTAPSAPARPAPASTGIYGMGIDQLSRVLASGMKLPDKAQQLVYDRIKKLSEQARPATQEEITAGRLRRGMWIDGSGKPFMPNENTTPDIKNFEYGQDNPDFNKYMEEQQRRQSKYGLQPIHGALADGTPAIAQLSDQGDPRISQFPGGFVPSKGIEKIDMADRWQIREKASGRVLEEIPKNVAEKERQEVKGKKEGEAQFNLPRIEQAGEYMLSVIDRAVEHPGRDTFVGKSGVLDPRNIIPGTDAKNYEAVHNQLKGGVFLRAYDELRGGGAITEIEGQKAEQAKARMARSQSDKEYLEALKELRGVVVRGLEVARRQAGAAAKPDEDGFVEIDGVRIRKRK